MKRALIGLLVLAMAGWPVISHAQYNDDEENPTQYNDVEDGQALKVISYLLTPFGMGLEWGLTRPLHYVATETAVGPIIAGDTETTYFGQTNNADLLPPGTFAPHVMTGQYTNYSFSEADFSGQTIGPGTPATPQSTAPRPAAGVVQPSTQPPVIR
jgi:hypothetical protein